MSVSIMLMDIFPSMGREVLWCAFCVMLLVMVVRLSWSIRLDRESTRRKCKASMRRKNKNVKKGSEQATSPQRRGGISSVSMESVKYVLTAAIVDPLRRLVISLPKPPYRSSNSGDKVGVRKGAGRRKNHRDGKGEDDRNSDIKKVEPCSMGIVGVSRPASANSNVAVQATEDGGGGGAAMEGWTVVERTCRRQHSSVSDSTSCSSSDRNAAGRKGGNKGTPPMVQPNFGRRPTKGPVHERLPIRKQVKPEEGRRRDVERKDKIDTALTPIRRHVWGAVDASRSLEGPLVSSIASSEDVCTYTNVHNMGKSTSSTTAPSECRLFEESPRSLLDSICAEPLYPDWVQKLMDECDTDEDKQDLPDTESPSSPPNSFVDSITAPEFSPVLSMIHATLHPCGIWVGLNHLARKIGYASGGWEMIWNLADIGWIELSDCGLYCRLGEGWGNYDNMLAPDQATDKEGADAAYSGSTDYLLPDWDLGESELPYDHDSIVGSSEGYQQDHMDWASPPTLPRGFANPPAMIIGLIK